MRVLEVQWSRALSLVCEVALNVQAAKDVTQWAITETKCGDIPDHLNPNRRLLVYALLLPNLEVPSPLNLMMLSIFIFNASNKLGFVASSNLHFACSQFWCNSRHLRWSNAPTTPPLYALADRLKSTSIAMPINSCRLLYSPRHMNPTIVPKDVCSRQQSDVDLKCKYKEDDKEEEEEDMHVLQRLEPRVTRVASALQFGSLTLPSDSGYVELNDSSVIVEAD